MPFIVRRIMNQFFGKFSSFSWEKYGQFGDSFGFLTAVFTAGAFYLLWKTYKTQKDELRETRKSLDLQRREMELARQSMDMQRYESSFFNLWRHYLDNIKEYRFVFQKQPLQGPAAIMMALTVAVGAKVKMSEASNLDRWYSIHKRIGFDALLIYNNLIVVLLLISRCPAEVENEYAKIVRLSTSSYEHILAAVISCGKRDEQAKRLVGKYLFPEGFKNDAYPIFDAPIQGVVDAAKV